jgi:hypothetical protein
LHGAVWVVEERFAVPLGLNLGAQVGLCNVVLGIWAPSRVYAMLHDGVWGAQEGLCKFAKAICVAEMC